MPQSFVKDPDAVLDYQVNWSDWLNGDTISTSAFAADPGITVDSDANTSTAATVWLSGGTAGSIYQVVNSITTAAGRSDDQTITIFVQQK